MKCILPLLTILLTGSCLHLSAQDRTEEIITRTISKIKVIEKQYRVVEKTIADNFFPNDTTAANRIYSYSFSRSNRYHLNAFASSQDVSDVTISIYTYLNNKLQLVTRNPTSGADVALNFEPQESKLYYIVVNGTLQANIQNTFFNLIIDRD